MNISWEDWNHINFSSVMARLGPSKDTFYEWFKNLLRSEKTIPVNSSHICAILHHHRVHRLHRVDQGCWNSAQSLGDDDEDFEINYLIERNFQVESVLTICRLDYYIATCYLWYLNITLWHRDRRAFGYWWYSGLDIVSTLFNFYE